MKGYEVTGTYPFNRNIFTDVEYAPSFVTDQPNLSSTVDEETTGTNPSNQSWLHLARECHTFAHCAKPHAQGTLS